MVHFWLRHETKPLEKRTLFPPETARSLLEAGFKVTVERSPDRCFKDEEYEAVGCTMAETNSWATECPADAVVAGLKELPESDDPLVHGHIMFAHCFKEQHGWKELLQRFDKGHGKLWDLEFLTHENGRRVAAFGFSAGFVGMAVGLLSWCDQQTPAGTPKIDLDYCDTFDDLVKFVRGHMERVAPGRLPRAMIIGALGRVGSGATSCALKCGIPEADLARWDMAETKKGGPFPEILDYDVLVNCIYLTGPTAPFITMDMLKEKKDRKVSVVVDVSCDYTSPYNPLPIYHSSTSFQQPTVRVLEREDGMPPVDVVAIDHLPSLVPRESSDEFADAMLPHLLQFPDSDVWKRALDLYEKKIALSRK
eukprot:TRINITY_DN82727_c0_g1_i1.p1 TRINITY_DN82727_c0_g1~~TRINITY_DN82727_c0_g1_i1.p1  ORF type:complete len:365 (+),score=96.68 TRINITY_DN82727_c0_g1_i1:193-1287(+)